MPSNKLLLSACMLAVVLLLPQCKKTAMDADLDLLNEAKAISGFNYYKSSDTILHSSAASAHKAYFRMKYNNIAFAAMTDNGKLPVGATFPEGSLVVKELFDSPNGAVQAYAIMKKESSNSSSEGGWLWGEYYADGRVSHNVAQKGDGCISCHSINSRDYDRVFDLFP